MGNRNNQCRVSIAAPGGPCFGRGFVADQTHVITCEHVVEYYLKALGRPLAIGSEVRIRNEAGQYLAMSLVKLGNGQDICVLARTDDGEFEEHECALWAVGKPGDAYVGLGMSAKFEDIGLSGTILADATGGQLQMVTAKGLDNRFEPGCSGAPLFRLSDDPAMIGMVAQYQQAKSGKICSAATLAAFWPSLKAFTPSPTEKMPSMPLSSPLYNLFREVDRSRQKGVLQRSVQDKHLLTETGFFVAEFIGTDDDLPFHFVNAVCDTTFGRIMLRLAPDSTKGMTPILLSLYDVIGEGADAASLLLDVLYDRLRAASSSIVDLREALRTTMRPLAIVMTASPDDLASLTPELANAWAVALQKLAMPHESQPVALFLYVQTRASDSISELEAQITSLGENWHIIVKPELKEIRQSDVSNWFEDSLKDDPSGWRELDKINKIIAKRSNGRDSFRLKHLRDWCMEERLI